MAEYILSCCSTADLSREHLMSRSIPYVCFHFFLNDEEKIDDLGISVPPKVLFDAIRAGVSARTAQVNADEYEAFFRPFLQEGKDVLHVTLSSGISGTINSAQAAAAVLREEFPERKIYIVDSLCASSGYGLFMDRLADLRDEGMTVDELRDWAEANKLRLNHWFFSMDLTQYIRGGRVSKTAGFVGGLLGICPLLHVNNEGKLEPVSKIPSKKLVRREIVKKMEQQAENGLDYSGKCYICQSDCMDDARKVADEIEKRFPRLNGKVQIYPIGGVIGCHTGPGTVALFYWTGEANRRR
ncbi:MAG: DegV family protein [Clostridia bacterium]|nr:DegV family protein [Clostridia bacterium]